MSLLMYTAGMNIAEQTWRDYSACTDSTLDFFDLSVDNTWQLKQVCDACPVQGDCLDASMHPKLESYGIWGGERPDTRRRLRRKEMRKEWASEAHG